MADARSNVESGTLTEQAVDALQRDILSGALKPGARLGVAELAGTYGIGTTPIREALSRLTSKNLVSAMNGRGFRVCQMTQDDLEDITLTRLLLEKEGVRLSMLHGGDDWEAEIVAQLHRLRLYVDRTGSGSGLGGTEFDHLHRQFHASLVSGCGSVRIISLAQDLYDQAYRYRAIMMRQTVEEDNFVQGHARLADAVRSRDVAHATALLDEHLRRTLCAVFPDSLPSGAFDKSRHDRQAHSPMRTA